MSNNGNPTVSKTESIDPQLVEKIRQMSAPCGAARRDAILSLARLFMAIPVELPPMRGMACAAAAHALLTGEFEEAESDKLVDEVDAILGEQSAVFWGTVFAAKQRIEANLVRAFRPLIAPSPATPS